MGTSNAKAAKAAIKIPWHSQFPPYFEDINLKMFLLPSLQQNYHAKRTGRIIHSRKKSNSLTQG
jgi:hypothetical protein